MSLQQAFLPVDKKRKRKSNEDVNNFDDLEDATDYLSRVVEQARHIPAIMVRENSSKREETHPSEPEDTRCKAEIIEGSAACLEYLVSHRTQLHLAPSKAALPAAPQAWAAVALEKFEQLQTYLSICHENGVGSERKIAVPPLKDATGWHLFCVGKDDAEGNAGGYFQDDDDDDDDDYDHNDATETEIPLWQQQLPPAGYHEPTVELVCQLDQVAVRRVLAHLIHFCNQGWSAVTSNRTQWLYALLARLDQRPLHRDQAAMLRKFLQTLSADRQKLQHKTELARVNLLMAIVGIHFGQGRFEDIMGLQEGNVAKALGDA